MTASQQKIVQYLSEARASEHALVRVLQSQIAMTPSGSYRSALETHLGETRRHAKRVSDRLESLDHGSNPFMAVVGFWEDAVGQTLAFSKTPFDLLRGYGRRGEDPQERQGRVRHRGAGDRDLYRDRAAGAIGRR